MRSLRNLFPIAAPVRLAETDALSTALVKRKVAAGRSR